MVSENDPTNREATAAPCPVLDPIADRAVFVQPGVEAVAGCRPGLRRRARRTLSIRRSIAWRFWAFAFPPCRHHVVTEKITQGTAVTIAERQAIENTGREKLWESLGKARIRIKVDC